MAHLAEKIASWRDRPALVQARYTKEGEEFFFLDEGSPVQRVSDKLLYRTQAFPLWSERRWKRLERRWDMACTWMVRDGWFQLPIIVLWRCSLASWFVWLGLKCAWRALWGLDQKV